MTLELIEDFPLHQLEGAFLRTLGHMLSHAKSLIVDGEESFREITALYTKAREWKGAIEDKRKALGAPLRKQIASINDKAAELAAPLDEIIDVANQKTAAYQRLLEEQKRAKDEEIRLAAQLFEVPADEVYIAPLEKNVKGDGAMMVTKTEKRFRVVDIAKVPVKYLTVNERAVEVDLNLGLAEIPGIEIYEETTTQLRKR